MTSKGYRISNLKVMRPQKAHVNTNFQSKELFVFINLLLCSTKKRKNNFNSQNSNSHAEEANRNTDNIWHEREYEH